MSVLLSRMGAGAFGASAPDPAEVPVGEANATSSAATADAAELKAPDEAAAAAVAAAEVSTGEACPRSQSPGPLTPNVSTSKMIPKGGYRRLLSIPRDISWEGHAPCELAQPLNKGAVYSVGPGGQGPVSDGPESQDDSTPSRVADDDGKVSKVAEGERDVHGDALGSGSVGDADGPGIGEGSCQGEGGREMMGREVETVFEDIRVSFTLERGSFATMCLREVMKNNRDLADPRSDGWREDLDRMNADPARVGCPAEISSHAASE